MFVITIFVDSIIFALVIAEELGALADKLALQHQVAKSREKNIDSQILKERQALINT